MSLYDYSFATRMESIAKSLGSIDKSLKDIADSLKKQTYNNELVVSATLGDVDNETLSGVIRRTLDGNNRNSGGMA